MPCKSQPDIIQKINNHYVNTNRYDCRLCVARYKRQWIQLSLNCDNRQTVVVWNESQVGQQDLLEGHKLVNTVVSLIRLTLGHAL